MCIRDRLGAWAVVGEVDCRRTGRKSVGGEQFGGGECLPDEFCESINFLIMQRRGRCKTPLPSDMTYLAITAEWNFS